MNKWKLKQKTKLAYPRVHEAINKLRENGYVKVSGTMKSEKGITIKKYGLTFKGVLAYLASIKLHPPKTWSKPSEDLKAFKKRLIREKKEYVKEIQQLVQVLKSYGELLNYTIFKEVDWLSIHFQTNALDLILKVAETYTSATMESSLYIRQLKRQKRKLQRHKKKLRQTPSLFRKLTFFTAFGSPSERKETEIDLLEEINERITLVDMQMEILAKEDEWLKQWFGERFLRRIAQFRKTKGMYNKDVHEYAKELLEKKRRQEVVTIEKAVELFSD